MADRITTDPRVDAMGLPTPPLDPIPIRERLNVPWDYSVDRKTNIRRAREAIRLDYLRQTGIDLAQIVP